MTRKILKIIGKILLGVLALAVVFLIGVIIIHKIITSKEKDELAAAGYINTVTVNGKDLNYNAYGNIGGQGYGFGEDSPEEQAVEHIVNTYREIT